MTSLEQKTLSGLKWSFVDTASRYFLVFFIGIVLARLLSPEDYGLVGMITIFMAISRVFIDGGFGDALIREKEPTQIDYSSVFYFNLFLSILLYLILFICSKAISNFFNEPQLIIIIRIVGLGLIFGSTSIIQTIFLKRGLDFKLQTKVSLLSTTISGFVSISMAFSGFGVWSLIMSGILSAFTSSIFLWYFNKWRPQMTFSIRSISKYFTFGSKIMAGSLINVFYNNMYYVLIGRFFPPSELGFYSKAESFQKLPSENIDTIVRQVTYPSLAKIQDEPLRLKKYYKILIRTTSFIVFILLLGMAATAKPMVVTLIGEKWFRTVPYLQLLCFVGILSPLISININILAVKGRSDLFLFVTILKVILSVPTLLLGYYFGISAMILGMLVVSIFIYFILIVITNNIIQYTVREQLGDIWPSIKIACIINLPIYLLSTYLVLSPLITLILLCMFGCILFFSFNILLRNQEYRLIMDLIKKGLPFSKKRNK